MKRLISPGSFECRLDNTTKEHVDSVAWAPCAAAWKLPELEGGQHTVPSTGLGQSGEEFGGIPLLAGSGKRLGAGIARRLGTALRHLIVAPCDDAARDQQRDTDHPDNIPAIARPELKQVVATQLLFDFAEYVAHKRPSFGRGGYHIR